MGFLGGVRGFVLGVGSGFFLYHVTLASLDSSTGTAKVRCVSACVSACVSVCVCLHVCLHECVCVCFCVCVCVSASMLWLIPPFSLSPSLSTLHFSPPLSPSRPL